MAIARVGVYTSASITGTTLTVNVPAGVSSGDVLLAFFRCRNIQTITPPAGWAELSSSPATYTSGGLNFKIAGYRRIAGGSEPASYSWTVPLSQYWLGIMGAYSGCDSVDPIDDDSINVDINSGAAPTDIVANSVTTEYANDMVVGFWTAYTNQLVDTYTLPAGYTIGYSSVGGHSADKIYAGIGATGTQTLRANFVNGIWGAMHVALAEPHSTTRYGPRIQVI